MGLLLPGFCRDQGLSPLPPAASRPQPTGRRSRPDPLGAVSDHRGKLSAEILARYFGPDRLCAAQGAVSQCARRQIVAARATSSPLPGQTGSAAPVQPDFLCRISGGGPVGGVSAIVAGCAFFLEYWES